MTESATVPAAGATKTAVDSTNTPDAATGTEANQPLTAGDTAIPVVKFGAWPSPINAAAVARGQTRISYPRVIGADIWWQEGRPDEDGRMTVVHRGADAGPRVLLPAPWNARTRVHEYGGLSSLPVPRASVIPPVAGGQPPRGHAIVFANSSDRRLYVAATEAADARRAVAPRPLTPDPATVDGAGLEPAGLRFADFALSPDGSEVWCVQERQAGGKITRSIVAVPLDGSAAGQPDAIRQLAAGSDFFAFPTPSPDGSRLAWISWNHPHMPWDGTELRVAAVENGVAGTGRLVKGGLRESVLAPVWRDNTSLYVATDWTGWWNIYQVGLAGEPPQALFPGEEEFAGPLWQLGARPFAMLGDGRLAVTHGRGGMRLGILDPETSELADLDIGFGEFSPGLTADGTTIVGVAGGPSEAPSGIALEARPAPGTGVRNPGPLPVPRPGELEGPFGRIVHALVYAPATPAVTPPAGELPPYVVW